MANVDRKRDLKGSKGAHSLAKARGDKFYFTGIPCGRGHVANRFTSTRDCVECKVQKRSEDPLYLLFYAAKGRARQRELPFNLTLDYVRSLWPSDGLCPVLGIPLVAKAGKGYRYDSPSLDRIDPAKGYVIGNVVVISGLANQIKSNATPALLRKVADWLEKVQL